MLFLRIVLDLFYGIKMLDVILELLWMKLVQLLWVMCPSSCLGLHYRCGFGQLSKWFLVLMKMFTISCVQFAISVRSLYEEMSIFPLTWVLNHLRFLTTCLKELRKFFPYCKSGTCLLIPL